MIFALFVKIANDLAADIMSAVRGYDEDDSCRQGENLIIDWEIVCNEYNIEYEK